jgi:uracil-DNA glycosylase family 4
VIGDLARVRDAITSCERCPRLREYCRRVGREKRAAYRHDTYWAKPVPGFGDPAAAIAIVGLAPAAHGANRTGRNFTGDGGGGSGDFLMAALHANGLANQPFSRARDDGLELRHAWIAAAVRCAPPENRPTLEEIAACRPHLAAELAALPNLRVYVALGRIAYDACWRVLSQAHPQASRPPFGHGVRYRVGDGPLVIAAYHPSRQNTNTGRLTAPMLREVFRKAAAEIGITGHGRTPARKGKDRRREEGQAGR